MNSACKLVVTQIDRRCQRSEIYSRGDKEKRTSIVGKVRLTGTWFSHGVALVIFSGQRFLFLSWFPERTTLLSSIYGQRGNLIWCLPVSKK